MMVLLEKLSHLLVRLSSEHECDSYRILHGRGRSFPALEFINVDFFQPVVLITCYQEPPALLLDALIDFLRDKLSVGLQCVLLQRRYLPGAPSEIVIGTLPEFTFARRGALKFHLHLNAQQNPGYFLDMEPGRMWLEQQASGKRVLNLFSYTCAFSVVAIAAGAEKVVNVDMSSAALNLGRANHQLNGLNKNCSEFLAENILKSWGRIKKRGPFDLVVIDPPSFQKGSFVATKDYAKIVRRLPELMPEGGLVLACLNAPELPTDFIKKIFEDQLPVAEFEGRLSPHVDFPDINSEQQLKLLIYRLAPTENLSLQPDIHYQ